MGTRVSRGGRYAGGKGGAAPTSGVPVKIGEIRTSVVLAPRAKKSKDVLVSVNVKKFDAAFAKDKYLYIGKGGSGGIHDRYPAFKKFLETKTPIEASEVSVRRDGTVGFTNGRHRYAVMRDSGLKSIPVSMDKSSVKYAKKFGLLR